MTTSTLPAPNAPEEPISQGKLCARGQAAVQVGLRDRATSAPLPLANGWGMSETDPFAADLTEPLKWRRPDLGFHATKLERVRAPESRWGAAGRPPTHF